MPSYLRKSWINKQQTFKSIVASDSSLRTYPLFHHNTHLLRSLPYFRISTPKISLLDGLNPFIDNREQGSIDFANLLILLKNEGKMISQFWKDKIKVFVCDEQTAIPYIVLSSGISGRDTRKNRFGREVLIVCHDFFENFIERIDFWFECCQKNHDFIIVLFNYPGQAYTYFSNQKIYNNEYNSTILDLLLYELQKQEIFFLRSDNFRVIGFGNGGNIITTFLSSHDGTLINFKYALLFNTFLYTDDLLADTLSRSIEVFEKFPLESPNWLLFMKRP